MTAVVQPVDAFLWDGPLAQPEPPAPRINIQPSIAEGVVIDVTPIAANEYLVPAGMFNQWPLEVLSNIHKPFTGLVVLVDLVRTNHRSTHHESVLQMVTACVASLLGENDFGCRTTEDEFVMVFPGLERGEAQRRLNQISERLWEFQQHGRGSCSLLFSWGGVGTRNKPLSSAMAAAVERMNQLNRNRRSHRKAV